MPSRGRLRRVALGALVGALIGAGAWIAIERIGGLGGDFAGGGEAQEAVVTAGEAPAETGPNDLPMRPPLRLEHPDGATAEVPAGETLYGDFVDLRRVEVDVGAGWSAEGSGWELISGGGIPFQQTAVIELPVGADPQEVVIVRSALGGWIELPSQATTRPTGQSVHRIEITDVPTPWTFALARPAPLPFEQSPEEIAALEAERRYWTDREAWRRETAAWLATALRARTAEQLARRPRRGAAPGAGPSVVLASMQDAETPSETYDRLRRDLFFTKRLLGAARLHIYPATGFDALAAAAGLPAGIPVPQPERVRASEVYVEGVRRLRALRDEWVPFYAGFMPIDQLSPEQSLPLGMLHQDLEETLLLYTPWGIDLVAGLIRDGTLASFDLRVLAPYGGLYWADVPLKVGQAPQLDSAVAAEISTLAASVIPGQMTPFGRLSGRTNAEPIAAESARVSRFLRLYSTSAVQRLSFIDWLKQDSVESVMRWTPVVLAAVGVIPGAVGMSAFFAAIDQVLSWMQSAYATDPADPYAYVWYEGLQAGGTGGTSFLLDMYEEGVLMASEGRAMYPSHGLTIAQFAYSVGVFAAVRGTDWYLFRAVRGINAGTVAYRGERRAWFSADANSIPPVMLHAIVQAPLKQALHSYPAHATILMAWRLDYEGLSLTGAWREARGPVGPRGPAGELPIQAWARDSWPFVVGRVEPQVQAVRLSVPRSAIPPEAWGSLPPSAALSEFRPTLKLESGRGSVELALRAQSEDPLPTDRADAFHVNFFVLQEGVPTLRAGVELPELLPGYRAGEASQAVAAGGLPSERLSASIRFADTRIPELAFDLDFTGAPVRPTHIRQLVDPSIGYRHEVRRVQYLSHTVPDTAGERAWILTARTPSARGAEEGYQVSISKGTISLSGTSYTGNDQSPLSLSAEATFDEPPERLVPGQTYELAATLRGSVSGEGAHAFEMIYQVPDGKSYGSNPLVAWDQNLMHVNVNGRSGPSTTSRTYLLVVPETPASSGDTLTLRVTAMEIFNHAAGSVEYVYRYR